MDVVIHHNDHDHETPVAVANLEDSLTLGLKDVETNGYNNTNVQTAVTDQEKRNLKTDAVSEVLSIIGLLIKFVAVTIFFIMLKDESPVSEYYQVNRAVKDTFMVDQAMEARNIQDTWDWLFAVVDRIGSHSRQSSMDDVEQFCQGVGQIELVEGDPNGALTAAYGNSDAYICNDADTIDLKQRQVFAAPNNELMLFSISQHRSSLAVTDVDETAEASQGFIFDSIYENTKYSWGSFESTLKIGKGDDQVIGIFGEWADKGDGTFGGLASGDDDKDYASAFADADAEMCVFADNFSPLQNRGPSQMDEPFVTGSTLSWEGITFEKDKMQVPAFYARDVATGTWQMAKIMADTNNAPKNNPDEKKNEILINATKFEDSASVELHPCWVVIDPVYVAPGTNETDKQFFEAMGYTVIKTGVSFDKTTTGVIMQSKYVPTTSLTSEETRLRYGVKKIRPIKRWKSICTMIGNDEFHPIDSLVAGGMFSWQQSVNQDPWLQTLCESVLELEESALANTYGYFSWPVTAAFLTPSQGDVCAGGGNECDGAPPADPRNDVYTQQVILMEDDDGLGRFLVDRAHLSLNQKLDWIDGNTRDLEVNMVSYNGNNDPVLSVQMMKFKFDTSGDVRAEFDVAMVPVEYATDSYGHNTQLKSMIFFIVVLLSLLTAKTAFEIVMIMFRRGKGKTEEPDAGELPSVSRVIFDDLANSDWAELSLDVGNVIMMWVHFIFLWGRNELWGKVVISFYEYTTDDSSGASNFELTETMLDLISKMRETLEMNDSMKLGNCIMVLIVTFQMLYSLSQAGTMIGAPGLGVVNRTMSRCFVDLLPLFVVFVLVLVTFGLLGHVTFGFNSDAFRSFGNSMLSVMQMLIGLGPEFNDLDEICYNSGEAITCQTNVFLFFWSYVVINAILVLNMVLAVVFGVYDEVRDEISEETAERPKLGPLRSIRLLSGSITYEEAQASLHRSLEKPIKKASIDERADEMTAEMAGLTSKIDAIAANLEKLASQSHY
jgi:hypothetical protein